MIIKEEPQDFLVDEVPLDDILSSTGGNHVVFLLKKTNYTTERAVTHLAKALHIPRKFISYAGTKDKKAITTQYITIKGRSKEKIESIELKDIELTFQGYRHHALTLGDLKGNTFRILVKDVQLPKNVQEQFFVPNYFDEQRFSTHNLAMGKLILKKQYKEAVDIVLDHDKDHSDAIMKHLEKQPNDYIGALRLLPKRTLLFYAHAVQSYVFNELLKQKVALQGETITVPYSEGELLFPMTPFTQTNEDILPLIGYDSPQGYGDIDPRDFLNKSLPELALEGSERQAYFEVKNCKLEQKEKGILCSFELRKGSYATIVLKQLFL